MQFKNFLILIGTFWPLAGPGLAVFIASLLVGWERWLLLFTGPVLLLLPCYLYFEEIADNGNLLFVALMGVVFMLAFVYYPVLVIIGMVLMIKQRQHGEGDGSGS